MPSGDQPSDDELAPTVTADGRGLAGVPLVSGAQVGRYEVDRQLGAGGMGIVYLARDPALDRRVALKLVRAGVDTARARLLREGQVIARLQHPNVVTVHDVGPHGDELFIAMEYVEGSTLGAWLDEPRSWREVLDVFGSAGRGLAAAHAAGLVHRDFKPDNVLLGPGGRVVVTDFGLARAQDGDDADPVARRDGPDGADLTLPGSFVGTPAYMAPEQIRGDAVDARSDQFSFCVALWEALHGARPFRRADPTRVELLAAIDGGIVPAPGDVPGWIDRAVRRGLLADPAARWPTMAALLAALAPRSRRPLIGGLGAIGVVGSLAAVALASRGGGTPAPSIGCDDDAAAAIWTPAARDAYTARAGAVAAAQDVPWFDRFAADWQLARASLCTASLEPAVSSRRRTCLDAALSAFGAAVARPDTAFWAALPALARCDGDAVAQAPILKPLAGRLGQYDMYTLSPDGERVAVTTSDGRVYLQAVDGGDEQSVPAADGSLAANILPDGRRLMVVNRDVSVDVLDLDTGARRRLVPWARAGDVSRDGKWFAYSDEHRVVVRPLDRDGEERPIASVAIGVPSLVWSPDGRWLASQMIDDVHAPHLQIRDPVTGLVASDIPLRLHAEALWVAWLPDGRVAVNGAHERAHGEGVWLLRVDGNGRVVEPPELRLSTPERTMYGVLGAGGDRVLLSRTDAGRLLQRHDPGGGSASLPGRIGDWMPSAADDRTDRLLVSRDDQVAWLTLADQSIARVSTPGHVVAPTLRDGVPVWLRATASGFDLLELGDGGERAIAAIPITGLTTPPLLTCAAGARRLCAVVGRRASGSSLVVVDGDRAGPVRAIDANGWTDAEVSPDGRSLAVTDRARAEITVHDLATLEPRVWSLPAGCRAIWLRWARAAPGVITYMTCETDDRLVRISAGPPVEISRFPDEILGFAVTADDTIYASMLRYDMTMLVATGL